MGAGPGSLEILDLDDAGAGRVIEIDPSEFYSAQYATVYSPVWSPDGSDIAVIAYREQGEFLEPTVQVVDVESGTHRELVGPEFGHIRQLAWSPDGLQLLLVAGDYRLPSARVDLNPLASPKATGLYLVSADGFSSSQEVATGHYVAAAWSPDGTQIAAVDYNGLRQVVLMNVDGSGSRILAERPADDLFTGIVWHPAP
jgi:Tol biopolymer transport system component